MSDENKPESAAGAPEAETGAPGSASDGSSPSTDAAQAGQPASAENQGQPPQAPINFLHQYVKDFSFEAPNAPQVFRQAAANPEVDIKVDVTAVDIENPVFESAIHFEIRAHDGDSSIYLIELVYAGLIRLNNVRNQDVEPLVLIEAPRLLFPFARALVAGVTREAGFAPLVLTPFDFIDLYKRRVQARQAQAAQAGAAQPPSTDAPAR